MKLDLGVITMRLIKWIQIHNMKLNEFAKKIGKNRSEVHKYVYEDVIPQRKIMMRIYRITYGAVTANDFYNFSEEIFDKMDDN